MVKYSPEQISRDVVCTCKTCNHGMARDCIKLKCTCCSAQNHSMLLDGMVGFGSLPSRKTSKVK